MITYRACLNTIRNALKSITDEYDIEAEILVFDCFNLTKAQFFLIQDNIIDIDLYNKLDFQLKERLMGKPLAYVLGYWDFFGSRYYVEPGVLVPRPETELLVEQAVTLLKGILKKYNQTEIAILELGVGSGIISIEVAKRFPGCNFHAWDISETAIGISKKNAQKFSCEQILFHHSNFFDDDAIYEPLCMSSKPTLFLSNPPYIPSQDIQTLDTVVKDFEPRGALDGGDDGLAIYRQCLDLIAKGQNISFVFEIGVGQSELLSKELDSRKISGYSFLQDFQGIDRVLWADVT